MYEIWFSQGNGTTPGPRFRLLGDAIRYVDSYSDPASLAIRLLDGNWYRWPDSSFVIRNRRRARRVKASASCRVSAQLERGQVEALRCRVKDVSSTGLGIVPWSSAPALSNGLAAVILGDGRGQFSLPAQVKWRGGRDLGLELMLDDELSQASYRRWLESVVGAHLQ